MNIAAKLIKLLPALLLALALPASAAGTKTAEDPHPRVLMQTSLGDITVELDREHAPASVANFLAYVKAGHYNGTIFHRVIAGFVAQGGGYDSKYVEKKTRAPIKLESGNGLSNLRGTIAMAREASPDTATAQFFFNLIDNQRLDAHPGDTQHQTGYAVFGKITSGEEILEKFAALETGSGGPFNRDVPTTAVVLKKVTILPPEKAQ